MYKASRRREYERVKMMDEEVAKEKADEDFEKRKEEMRKKDEGKTEKNRKRREKNKQKKGGKNQGTSESHTGVVKANGSGGPMRPSGLRQGIGVDDEEMPPATAEEVGVTIHDDD